MTKAYIGCWSYPVNEMDMTVCIGGKDVPLNIAMQVPFSYFEEGKEERKENIKKSEAEK